MHQRYRTTKLAAVCKPFIKGLIVIYDYHEVEGAVLVGCRFEQARAI